MVPGREAVTALLLLAAAAALGATPHTGPGILNFHEVSTGIYRGGQPTTEGWAFLKEKGVKTVVKLNFEEEGSDAQARTLGMTVIDASGPPATIKNVWGAPKPERLQLAVNALGDKRLHPIYVHCLHGQDRTGLVVGLHRVINEGVPKQTAWEEMKRIGFHRSLRGLRAVWRKFDGKTIPGTVKND
ncbi:MAG: tyrosine-protein phosphatase [Elusimicrobiota bacterium]|nr:MAG: tyrosine-protein phosphatase [Elusimicrobiota bacterium]